MNQTLTLAVIGDYDETYTLHRRTDAALQHAAGQLGVALDFRWVATMELDSGVDAIQLADALVCGPAPAPYSSVAGVLAGLRFGREQGVPTLGTCGGCQHMVLEFAQNVLGLQAGHAGYDAGASDLVISPLSCSLVGRTGTVDLLPQSRVAEVYGRDRTQEEYFCSYGVNPEYEPILEDRGLAVVGRDATDGVARVLEIHKHPFYVAALFVPQARSTPTDPHPLFVALLREAMNNRTGSAPKLRLQI